VPAPGKRMVFRINSKKEWPEINPAAASAEE
jgi:hypothetical protein